MHSPAVPLLWEIWSRRKGSVAALAGATALSWVIDFTQRNEPPEPNPSVHNQMLAMMSFVLLLAMFSYIESAGDRGMGRFPRRLFRLPVSTLQLVAVPVIAGIVGIELLYLVWMERLSVTGPRHQLFVAVLLAAFMVFYQAVLWTLDRLGPLRLIVLGALGGVFFWIGSLPSIGESGWQTRGVLGGVAAALAVGQFILIWRHVARARSEAESDASPLGLTIGRVADALPRRRSRFESPADSQLWFEWRCSGSGFPALVAGALVLLLVPATVLISDPADTVRVIMAALALPVAVAIPAGLAFSKPMFWSEEMSLQPVVSIKPVADEDLIAMKIKVAAIATAVVWLLVLAFLAAWLTLWANQAAVRAITGTLRMIDADWWLAIVALVVLSAMFVSWRFLVAGIWAGMSGNRRLFTSMLIPFALLVIAGTIFDVAELPRSIARDLRRLDPFIWMAGGAAVAKLGLAARGFRLTAPSWTWRYVAAWSVGVACLVALAAVGIDKGGQGFAEGQRYRVWAAFILLAVLSMPLARVAWAPWFLGRNRHRQ